MLWGALAQVVKALSLLRFAHPLNSHNDIRKFLRDSIKFANNNLLLEAVDSSDRLHVNFYETYLDDIQFKIEYDKTKALLMYFKGLIFSTENV